MPEEIDLKAAINAVSDVIQNRPRPIREFDQIYMKTGDMVMQSEFVANWSDDRKLAFIGDGDSISVCVAYLRARGIVNYGPSKITVFDFDERIVNAINRFAEREKVSNLDAVLYNCFDALSATDTFDCFYTNPPWGASNNGESVNLFVKRGFEAVGYQGDGLVVIADDDELDWTKEVLGSVQSTALSFGFYVSRMMPRLHEYHLDDTPSLKSCNLALSSLPSNSKRTESRNVVNPRSLKHFYGRNANPHVKYVRERVALDYGVASQADYELEYLKED